MLNHIDFSCNQSTFITLTLCLLFPVILFFITRVNKFRGKNAQQFLVCTLITLISWLSTLILTKTIFFSNAEIITTNIFIIICALLVYLEIWGLLSRGYTIGLLLTFYKIQKPLNEQELADSYRGGQGLAWLIDHRFRGLITAGLLRREGDYFALTKKGAIIAFFYEKFIQLFGLRQTG